MTEVSENLQKVRDEIHSACLKADRSPESVRLIAVSKNKPLASIIEAFETGQRVFAENYVQEATKKFTELRKYAADRGEEVELHYIGHLQSNKSRAAVELFDIIQSVDRLKLVESLAREAEKLAKRQKIMIQVNISSQNEKSGIAAADLPSLVDRVLAFPKSLELKGLMAIGSAVAPLHQPNRKKGEFEALAYLRQREASRVEQAMPELSMGMSSDLANAIGYGATMVRVGRAIFGDRT